MKILIDSEAIQRKYAIFNSIYLYLYLILIALKFAKHFMLQANAEGGRA